MPSDKAAEWRAGLTVPKRNAATDLLKWRQKTALSLSMRNKSSSTRVMFRRYSKRAELSQKAPSTTPSKLTLYDWTQSFNYQNVSVSAPCGFRTSAMESSSRVAYQVAGYETVLSFSTC